MTGNIDCFRLRDIWGRIVFVFSVRGSHKFFPYLAILAPWHLTFIVTVLAMNFYVFFFSIAAALFISIYGCKWVLTNMDSLTFINDSSVIKIHRPDRNTSRRKAVVDAVAAAILTIPPIAIVFLSILYHNKIDRVGVVFSLYFVGSLSFADFLMYVVRKYSTLGK